MDSPFDLSGQVVAVTGASSGIGEATALACAQAGAAVALAARRAERIQSLAERIVSEGGRAIAVPTDVGDEAQARVFIERAHAELGRLDVLPVDDLGLRVGVQRLYSLSEKPSKNDVVRIAEPWRPYRSIATWYFWRSLGGVPQSQ